MDTKRTAVFYGSTTGTTKDVAFRLARIMGIDDKDVYNVKDISPSVLGQYQNIIAGTSTWGDGQMQADWWNFVDGMSALSLPKAKVALFGCGDETMSDTFCSAVGELYRRFKATGAVMIGEFDTVGYDYSHSGAEIDGHIVGLLLDEVNHPEATNLRLRAWAQQLKDEFSK